MDRRLELLPALLAACSSVEPVAPPSRPIAFVGVAVVPMSREVVLEDHTVLVEGDRIVRVGPTREVPIPHGAIEVDGAGRYLMPGLADMHVHVWAEDHLWLLLANGVTQVRNMWGAPMHLRWREEIECGSRVGPSIFTLSPLLDGPGAYWSGSEVVATPAEARDAVERAHALGYDGLKVYSKLSIETYDAIVEAAGRLGMRVEGHVPIEVGLQRALESGQLSSEHLTGLAEATLAEGTPMPPASSFSEPSDWVRTKGELALRIRAGELTIDDVYDPHKIAKVVEAIAEAAMWMVPTLVAFNDLPEDEARSALDAPVMRFVDGRTKEGWHPDRNPFTAGVGEDVIRANELWHVHRRRLVRSLHAAGAGVLLGTDCLNPFVVPGFSVHDELDELVACGLRPYEALEAGTVDAARFLDQADEWGAVAEGMRADLVLLDANPLDDVGGLQQRVGVMVRGKWLPERELLAGLQKIAAKHDAQETFFAAVSAGDIDRAWDSRAAWTREHGVELVDESGVNGAGYELLAEERFEEATDLLGRNADAYPESANAWDSLAEACMLAGRAAEAISHYERSLALDPSNSNAAGKLRELRNDV